MQKKTAEHESGVSPEIHEGFISFFLKLFYSIIASFAAFLISPDSVKKAVGFLVRLIYPCKVAGIENFPTTGALIAANHISLIDGLIIQSVLDRPINFLISEKTAGNWFVKPWLHHFSCISLVTSKGIKQTVKALRLAAGKIEQGELVCVFPEGHVSRTATLLPFRTGLKIILKNNSGRIIPAYIDNLWGSIFSFCQGRFITRIPPSFRRRVGLVFGQPLDARVSAPELRLAVQNLGPKAWEMRRQHEPPIHRLFLQAMRSRPFSSAFGEIKEPFVSRILFLIRTIAVTRAANRIWAGQKNVGIMIPTTPAAAMLNIASSITGRVSVNLNFTSGRNAIRSAVRQAQLETVITAKPVEQRFPALLPDFVKKYYIEDIAAEIAWYDKLIAAVTAVLAPTEILETIC
ncbi:MAG: 1-acyl-sn-glycerol-3-phosphate acyltransferase, partial [Candidatus Rifleibacteriota bacterium]